MKQYSKLKTAAIVIAITSGVLLQMAFMFIFFSPVTLVNTNTQKKNNFAAHGGSRVVVAVDESSVPAYGRSISLNATKDSIYTRLSGLGYVLTADSKVDNDAYEIVLEFPDYKYDQHLLDAITPKSDQLGFGIQDPNDHLKLTPTKLNGTFLEKAEAANDARTGIPQIILHFNEEGAKLFYDITSQNVGKAVAIYFGNKLLAAPIVQEPISGGEVVISGNYTFDEAKQLAGLIQDSAVSLPLSIVSAEYVSSTTK